MPHLLFMGLGWKLHDIDEKDSSAHNCTFGEHVYIPTSTNNDYYCNMFCTFLIPLLDNMSDMILCLPFPYT